MDDYKMYGCEERRDWAKQQLSNLEEFKKTKEEQGTEHVKSYSTDELLELFGYKYEPQEERQKLLERQTRTELEKNAVCTFVILEIHQLSNAASDPTWEEKQAPLKKYGAYRLECWHCGREFYARYPLARYCTYRCVNDAYQKRRKERKEEIRGNRVRLFCQKKFSVKKPMQSIIVKVRVLACVNRRRRRRR